MRYRDTTVRVPAPFAAAKKFPGAVPVDGALTCAGLAVFPGSSSWVIGLIGLASGGAWYGIRRSVRA